MISIIGLMYVIPIHLLPLRERRDDIPFLVDDFFIIIKLLNERCDRSIADCDEPTHELSLVRQ